MGKTGGIEFKTPAEVMANIQFSDIRVQLDVDTIVGLRTKPSSTVVQSLKYDSQDLDC